MKPTMNFSPYKLYNQLSLSLVFLLLIACNSNNDKGSSSNEKRLLSSIEKIDPRFSSELKLVYLIMPNEGCDGCISTAEEFVKTHYRHDDNLRFIFTKSNSIKMLKNKLGKHVYEKGNVIIDSANLIDYPNIDKSIYPMIVYVEKGAVEKISYQSPGEGGIEELSTHFKR